jgi:hypothetical protein
VDSIAAVVVGATVVGADVVDSRVEVGALEVAPIVAGVDVAVDELSDEHATNSVAPAAREIRKLRILRP